LTPLITAISFPSHLSRETWGGWFRNGVMDRGIRAPFKQ
jgi:hypothetical protein